jgi:hypothetical protein
MIHNEERLGYNIADIQRWFFNYWRSSNDDRWCGAFILDSNDQCLSATFV